MASAHRRRPAKRMLKQIFAGLDRELLNKCRSAIRGGDDVNIKTSPRSADDTVSRLRELLDARGIKLFAVIDHSGEAEAVGLELRNTKVVVFGSPRAGTPVMAAAPLAALDLPLRVLVWDDGVETRLAYTEPAELAARYGLTDELVAHLAAIDVITDTLIEP